MIVDKKGDEWTVYPCDGEPGCIVVQRTMKIIGDHDDHIYDLHIPIGVIDELCTEMIDAVADCDVEDTFK